MGRQSDDQHALTSETVAFKASVLHAGSTPYPRPTSCLLAVEYAVVHTRSLLSKAIEYAVVHPRLLAPAYSRRVRSPATAPNPT